MFKPSRRAVAIAASFALGLSVAGPAAHAGLLGGSDDDSMAVEGIGLPVGGDLLSADLLGGLLDTAGGLLGSEEGPLGAVLGADGLLGGVLFGGEDGLLGGDLLGGGLPVVGALGGGGLPLVGDVLGEDGLLGEDGVLGGELLSVVTGTTLDCDAAIPQVLRGFLGDTADVVCEPFSDGVLGLLSSL